MNDRLEKKYYEWLAIVELDPTPINFATFICGAAACFGLLEEDHRDEVLTELKYHTREAQKQAMEKSLE